MKLSKEILCDTAILLLTAILFLAGLYLVDRLVTPEERAEALYDEPKNSIDVLMLGGSQTMCTLSCTGIYEGTGLTAYNFSTWSQPVWVSYYYLKETLKYQQPKVVVLDVFGAFYDRTYMTGVDVDLVSDDFAPLLKPSLNLLQMNLTRRRVQVTKKRWYEYLNIAKYHSRITELTADSFLKLVRDDSTPSKGYEPFYTMEDFSSYEYPATNETIEMYPYAEEYLRKTIELCLKKGIRPVLIKIPHIASEQDIAVLNGIHALADSYGVDFLDYCTTNRLNIDLATDYADHGHLNNYGAKKTTADLVSYLDRLDLEPVHTDAITNRWELACAAENREQAEMEIRISKSFDALVSLAAKQGSSAVILAKQDSGVLTPSDYAEIEALFADTVFALPQKEISKNNLFVYADGQLLVDDAAERWCAAHAVSVTTGAKASIVYDGQEYSYARDGLNAVVLDTDTKNLYHRVSFAKEHRYTPFTE